MPWRGAIAAFALLAFAMPASAQTGPPSNGQPQVSPPNVSPHPTARRRAKAARKPPTADCAPDDRKCEVNAKLGPGAGYDILDPKHFGPKPAISPPLRQKRQPRDPK